jgi:hypothetical protein
MFNKNSLFIFLLIIGVLNACQQRKTSAKQYHNEINTALDTIIPYFISLDDDIALDSTSKAKTHFKQLQNVVNSTEAFISSKSSFPNESTYYENAHNLSLFYKSYTDNEIKKVLEQINLHPNDPVLKESARVVFVKFYEKEQLILNDYNKSSIDFTYKYKIYKANAQ